MSFCIEANEPKFQDWNLPLKIISILNLREFGIYSSIRYLVRASNTRIFLTFSELIFLTLQPPRSIRLINKFQFFELNLSQIKYNL